MPQIGGPAARARGLTGQGVTVALLDSGIDASHPDLAGKVVASENFVDDGRGSSDVIGHATHVASIIAGSGAASGGQFRGVAPDARSLSGRVCRVDGCPSSSILAGIAWAVADRHAPIVNLSLGVQDGNGQGPVEDAINQVSAQYGTLFVISAGNSGAAGEQTIDSPRSAEAALTVGAVDRNGRVARFSGQGPLLEGDAIKPDITAPGVEIVAARDGGPGERRCGRDGVPDAGRDVAGERAPRRRRRAPAPAAPGWTGARLKAALIGSARPHPAFSAFQQGAGLVDVDRATRQEVVVEPATLGLGVAPWPHGDDPRVLRRVTYRNEGAAAGAAYASLRGTVRDVAGNASEVTILHASRLAARGDR